VPFLKLLIEKKKNKKKEIQYASPFYRARQKNPYVSVANYKN